MLQMLVENIVCPDVGKHIWAIYIMPRLMHGLEALVLKDSDITKLEDYYRRSLRAIQGLPKSTAIPAIYLLIGIPPLEAQLHIKILCFFASALRRADSLEYQVIQRQLAMKSDKSSSWPWYVQRLLRTYHLPSAFQLLAEVPSKEQWKRQVKRAVLDHWEQKLKNTSITMKTMSHVNLNACNLHALHPIWRSGAADPLTVTKAALKARLLVQRYPLHYSRTAGIQYNHPCPLCGDTEESMSHFLIKCPALERTRQPYMIRLLHALCCPSQVRT